MKRSFFPFFLQTIRIHYQDPELAFYTKGVLGLLWLVQLPVALWYGAPAQFYALLGAMLLAIGVDLVPFPRQHSRADDYVTSAVMLVCCFVLFWKASIGYFSVFFLLIYLFCNVFILGIAGSALFSLLGLTGVMLCLRGVLVADPAARYGADFVPRLPFLFLCILGIAYIITSATGWKSCSSTSFCKRALMPSGPGSRRCRSRSSRPCTVPSAPKCRKWTCTANRWPR